MIFNIISAASTSLSALIMQTSDSLKGDIENIRLWFFWSLIGSTILVMVGVLIEGAEHFIPETMTWRKRMESVGWTLVLMGVLGEGVFEVLTTTVDNTLQEFNGTMLAIATDQARGASTAAKAAKSAASSAKSIADAAKLSAGDALDRSKTANDAADMAQEKAGEAEKRVTNVEEKAEQLRQQIVLTEAQINEEHNKRMALEKSLKPRRLCFARYTDGTENIDNLKALAGLRVIVEAIPDFEAKQAAAYVVSILRKAGLVVIRTGITDEFVWDGVEVEQYMAPVWDNAAGFDELRSTVQAETVIEFLGDNDWVALAGWAGRGELERDMLRIRVGYKPNPYFTESQKPDPQHRRLAAKIPNNKPTKVYLCGFTPFPEKPEGRTK